MAVGTLKSNAYGFLPDQVPNLSGRLVKGREGSGTQAWKVGAVLVRSSGTVVEASAGATTNIIGVSSGVSAGVANTEALFYPATPDFVYTATLENQSTEDHALILTDIFTAFGIHVDTSTNGNWYVNFNDTSTKSVVVLAPVNWADIDNATVRARVKVIFLETTTAFSS